VCTSVEAEKTVDELNSIKTLHTGDEKISELQDKTRNYAEYNTDTSSWSVFSNCIKPMDPCGSGGRSDINIDRVCISICQC